MVPGSVISGFLFWMSIASSSDGNKLAAVVAGGVYTSSDSGVTWVDQSLVPGSVISGDLAWMSIASSSDDTKLAAVVFGGSLYTSNDSGVTWVDQSLVPGGLGARLLPRLAVVS